MKELLITRHGQTEWNVAGRLQGISNSPLTERGIRDAKNLGRKLKEVRIDKVICSDLLRAKETARLIIGDRAPIQTEPLLREIHMGGWEGQLLAELKYQDPESYRAFEEGSAYFHPPGGESMQEVWHRIEEVLQKIQQDPANTILLVTHGKTQGLLLDQLQGKPFGGATQVHAGTALSRFLFDGKTYDLQYLADTSHMEVDV